MDAPAHRRRVFSLSLGDWLDPEVPVEWLADMLDVIRRCPELDFQLLTKRPEFWKARIVAAIQWRQFHDKELDGSYHMLKSWLEHIPPPNIWLGVSVENQEAADRRIPELLRIPAKVRFLSVEPLLEPVDLSNGLGLMGAPGDVDWVIVGGESGRNRRDCGVEAIVSVAEQCRAAGVPVFVKQDCAAKAGQQGRIPDNIWNLKQFPNIEQAVREAQ
jgi:protein gp37